MANSPTTALVESGNVPANGNLPVTLNAQPSNPIFSGFVNLNFARQIALMIGLAASVAIGFAVVLWSQNEGYQPIYGNMEGYNMSLLMETLDAEQVAYRVDPNSGVILVPSDDISSIRLRLAAAGISRYDGTGYELLDEEQGLGTSQFMEASRFKRSQEGELQRTIASFKSIQSARVHIAIPERSVFVRSYRKPTASVFLVLNSGASLAESQTSAIANLVASSVPELNKEDVTIVDQRGNLLTRKESNTPLDVADKQFDYVRRLEGSLVERVNGILLPIVGIDGFKAEVSADIDFTQSEQADEVYDPDLQVVRSEQSLSEQRSASNQEGGIAGALSNQPPLDGTAPEVATAGAGAEELAVSGNTRQQSTRNYELGRTISYTSHDPVEIRRISVAVVVDNRQVLDSDETLTWTEEELAQLTTLVKDAVGFNEERGDRVSVMNNVFSPIEVLPEVTIPLWQQPWVLDLAKQLLAGLFVLFLALGVLRPVLKNIANGNSNNRQLALAAAQGGYNGLDSGGEAALAAPAEAVIVNKPDGYEAQLRAVKGIVAEDPSRVAQVVKQWIGEDGEQ